MAETEVVVVTMVAVVATMIASKMDMVTKLTSDNMWDIWFYSIGGGQNYNSGGGGGYGGE